MNASYKKTAPKKDAPVVNDSDDYMDEFDFMASPPAAPAKNTASKKKDFKKPGMEEKDKFKKKYAGKGAHKDGVFEAKQPANGSNKYEKTKPGAKTNNSERANTFKELALKKGREKAGGETPGGYDKKHGAKSKFTPAAKASPATSREKPASDKYEKPASSAFKSNRDKIKIANKRPVKK